MSIRSRSLGLLVAAIVALPLPAAPAQARIWDSVPDETLRALELDRQATPAELFTALEKRWRANFTKGKFAKWWEPLEIDRYLAPTLFYEPPEVDIESTREQCVSCHVGVTHGWVKSWQKSVHANLDSIRTLPADDVRAYKKEIIVEVEDTLRSMGRLEAQATLKEVGCIDCHMGVGRESGHHVRDLRMPDRAVCGTCHLRQFAEAESERDTLVWPQQQWPDGHPSHTVDYMANVELATWAALPQREVAVGCTMCHTNQAKCDNCHTRHEFSTVESRKPEACATCHNGVDHNEFENYMMSKHGTGYQTHGSQWNWHARLQDAMDKGGQTAPTCQSCHFEYNGKYTHNVVRKVRWAFLPFKNIADNLEHEWFQDRQKAWIGTCSQCHSPRFAKTYLEMADKGIVQGIELVEQSRKVVQKLYDDGLMVGQKTNRPAPPEPEKDEAGGFYSLFLSEGNNPTVIDRTFAEMWEQHAAQHMKALQHVNPGGWTYSAGWSDLIRDQTIINEADTMLREKAALERRLSALEAVRKGNADGTQPGDSSGPRSDAGAPIRYVVDAKPASPEAAGAALQRLAERGIALRRARVLVAGTDDPRAELVFAENDGERVLLDWRARVDDKPFLRLQPSPDELVTLADALKRHLPPDAVVFAWWDTSRALHTLSEVPVAFARHRGEPLIVPPEWRSQEASLAELDRRFFAGDRARNAAPDPEDGRFARFVDALLSDEATGIATLRALAADRPAVLVLHVRDVLMLGALDAQRIGVAFRDLPAQHASHGAIRIVRDWMRTNGFGAYTVLHRGDRPLRAVALTDQASGETLAARLLPFIGNRQDDVAGATLVYRTGAFVVFELDTRSTSDAASAGARTFASLSK